MPREFHGIMTAPIGYAGAVMKTQIIKQLGQGDILLPSLVAEALAANDRIKVRLSALQTAAQHAREPARPTNDLALESRTARS